MIKLEGRTVVLGNYESTRMLDQLKSFYSKCYTNPEPSFVSTLGAEKSLVIFDYDDLDPVVVDYHTVPFFFSDKHPFYHQIQLMNKLVRKPNHSFDLLLLKDSFSFIDVKVNLENVILFPDALEEHWQHVCPRKQWDWIAKSKSQGPLWIRSEDSFVCKFWPKEWSPEYHKTFPQDVQDRVLILLQGQSDPGSVLHRLDKPLLFQIMSLAVINS